MKARNRLKIVLAEKEMKSKDLASKINTNKSTVSGWVNNRSQPSLDKIYLIADALQCDVCDLLTPLSDIKGKP